MNPLNRPLAGFLNLLLLLGGALFAEEPLHLQHPGPGVDATPLLRQALADCQARGIKRLVLEPGQWEFHPQQAVGMFRHISNHDPAYRRIALQLNQFENFELDAGGSTFLCHGAILPFAVDHSKNITIRNLTMNWERLFHIEGTVVAVGEDYFDLKVLPESHPVIREGVLMGGIAAGTWGPDRDPDDVRQDFTWNYWIDPQTRAAAAVQGQLHRWNPVKKVHAEVTELGPLLYRIRNAHTSNLPELGSVMVAKGMRRMNRLSPAFHLNSSDGVLLENITIHHAGGMGVLAEDCANPTLRKFNVQLAENPRSLVTATADSTHFVGCRGTVTVQDSLFENMLDDACNVHGIYALVDARLAPDQLGISFSHYQQLGTAFARPGDMLQLIERDTLLGYGGEHRLSKIERVNEDYYILTFEQPIGSVYRANSSLENVSTRPDFIFRNNISRNNRARSVLISAGGRVLIEGNRFERPSMMSVLIEGDNRFWYESGAVTDVTIRNNSFIGHSPTAALFKLAPNQQGAPTVQPPYHRNPHSSAHERSFQQLIEVISC